MNGLVFRTNGLQWTRHRLPGLPDRGPAPGASIHSGGRLGIALVLFLAGCASGVPEPVRRAPETVIGVEQVRRDATAFAGMKVRWGGIVIGVENRDRDSLIEVLSQKLDRSGRPIASDKTEGRFLARREGFVDPAVYKEGREITIVGTVRGSLTRTIGGFRYTYPLISAETLHLWKPRPEPKAYPYYWDPYWPYPWYPGYPYYGYPPYYHPPYFH